MKKRICVKCKKQYPLMGAFGHNTSHGFICNDCEKQLPIIETASLTLAQQGGIGYPPQFTKWNGKWHFIKDSRSYVPLLCIVPAKTNRTQTWFLRNLEKLPEVTWQKIESKLKHHIK